MSKTYIQMLEESLREAGLTEDEIERQIDDFLETE